jgi:predicted dehydrogenase
MKTRLGIVGCGYVADSYAATLQLHNDALQVHAVYDRQQERLAKFSEHWRFAATKSLDDLLGDPSIDIVVNLTDPHNHESVTERTLAAGKHVYSEKPLAMTAVAAERLAARAGAAGLRLAAAPCNLLGEHAQTLQRAVRDKLVGDIRLIYAEMDDGMIHRAAYQDWHSSSGAPWPIRGELEVGCTFEHAGYTLGVLVAIFGPVRSITAFADLCIPDKGIDPPLDAPAPDFSVGLLKFEGGVTARMTNSIVAKYDHTLQLFGDEGTLRLGEPWSYHAPVRRDRISTSRLDRLIERRLGTRRTQLVPLVRWPPTKNRLFFPTMDFMRGVRELADAIREERPCRMSSELAVHVTEVTEVLQHPERFDLPYRPKSAAGPIAPMPWAMAE